MLSVIIIITKHVEMAIHVHHTFSHTTVRFLFSVDASFSEQPLAGENC